MENNKTYGVDKICIYDPNSGEEISVGTVTTNISDIYDVLNEAAIAANSLAIAFTTAFKINKKQLRELKYAFGILKPSTYYRTEIALKIHNRTRKKQCLTRLQRRQKRQRK